jgi:ankyrin repeat protein
MVTRRRKTVKKFKKPSDGDMFLNYIATGQQDLVEDYLERGGDVKVRNCKGETALHIAVAYNQNDILERLLPYFNEDELDIRDMYGLPPHMTAIKHGNEYGAILLSQYHKMIKTKPYKFKNYSFARSIKKGKKQPLFQQALNTVIASNQNPVIYPNQNRETINIWSYIPTRPNKNISPFVVSYNNKNTKVLQIINKPKRTRKKSLYKIKQMNKNRKSH